DPKLSPEAAAAPAQAVRPGAPPLRTAREPPPDRKRILAAVQARSASLRTCAPAAVASVPPRLHLTRSGAMRAVEFARDPPPAPLAECVRAAALAWDFRELRLTSDLELLVTLALSPELY